jgi:hypothetical protein
MGSVQSTHTTSEIKEIPHKEGAPPSSVSGRKESTAENVLVEPHKISTNLEDTDTDVSSGYESDDDSDDSDEEGKHQWCSVACVLSSRRYLIANR